MGQINCEDIFSDPDCPWVFPWSVRPKPDIAYETAKFHWGIRVRNSPLDWQLPLIAYRGVDFVGTIDLRGVNFAQERVIETGSYVLKQFQGQGIGTRMRQIAASYCFGCLGANTLRSKWHPLNRASAAVSMNIGYVVTGQGEEDGRPVVIGELSASGFSPIPIDVKGHTPALEKFLGIPEEEEQ